MADPVQPLTAEHVRAKQLIDKLWNDGELGSSIRKAAKKEFGIDIPDDHVEPIRLEVQKELEAARKEREEARAEREAARKEAEEAAMKRTLEQTISQARDKYSLTDDGMTKMLDRMKTTGNFSDAEAAAAWVAQQTPPPVAANPSWLPQDMNLFGTKDGADEKFKQLHRDPVGYMDAELREFIRNPDAYVAAA